jgi:predicted metal-binding membrane protein
MTTGGQNPGENPAIQALKWDRSVIITSALLMVVAVLAWISTINHIMSMQDMRMDMAGVVTDMQGTEVSGIDMPNMGMPEMEMPGMVPAAAGLPGALGILWPDAIAFLLAWGVMMAAMMLPSATPMIAFYGAVRRNAGRTGEKGIPTTLFALVYLVLWLLFGVPVYIASRLVEMLAGSTMVIAAAMPYLFALTLIVAGGFQFTRLKEVCLQACQHPMMFLFAHWRSGYNGTFRMALKHAGFCIGCCWALMVVLVVLGAMALHWMLLFSLIIAAEKLIPRGQLVARIFGGLLIAGGLLVLIQPNLVSLLRGMGM